MFSTTRRWPPQLKMVPVQYTKTSFKHRPRRWVLLPIFVADLRHWKQALKHLQYSVLLSCRWVWFSLMVIHPSVAFIFFYCCSRRRYVLDCPAISACMSASVHAYIRPLAHLCISWMNGDILMNLVTDDTDDIGKVIDSKVKASQWSLKTLMNMVTPEPVKRFQPNTNISYSWALIFQFWRSFV